VFRFFTADIIYHLYDSVTKYMAEVREKKRGESADVTWTVQQESNSYDHNQYISTHNRRPDDNLKMRILHLTTS